MAFSFVDTDNVFDTVRDAKQYMLPWFEPLAEYQRIARNRPHPGIDKAYPKTTDGTTASIIQKTPRRIIQQLPTGKVVSDSNDWLTHVAGFIYTNRIILNANSQYALIQKSWLAVKNALTNGASVGYVPFINRGDYFGTDLILPNIKDVWLEKGKVSDSDSNVICMRGWYQPNDIKSIIDKETKLQEKSKSRKQKYTSDWDLKALAKIQDDVTAKQDVYLSETEKLNAQNAGGVEIIHVFQRGVGAKFYSIHLKTQTIVRTCVNKDPRGEIPIHYLYADIDGVNPLGYGYVELVGSLQNLMDSEMQMYQFNRALMLAPPIEKRGNFSKTQIKLVPNSVWDLGADPNNSAKPIVLDSTAIANFPALYGLTKSQLLNMLASPDTSVSADVGNPGFSKTPAGVTQQATNISVDDNYVRKMFETWYGRVSETMINRYFAEKTGIEEVQVDEITADKLADLDPSSVGPGNKIRINWDTETPKLQFKVDMSTSIKKDDQEEIAQLQQILTDTSQNPYVPYYLESDGYELHIGDVYKQIFQRLGVQDIDKIITKIPEQKDAQGNVIPPKPSGMSPTFDKPRVVVNAENMPMWAQLGILKNAGIDIAAEQMSQPNIEQQIKGAKAGQESQGAKQAGTQNSAITLPNGANVDAADLVKLYQLVPEGNKADILNLFGIQQSGVTMPTEQAHLSAVDMAHKHVTALASPTDGPQPSDTPATPTQDSATQAPTEQAPSPDQTPQFSPEDQQFIAELQKMGYSEQQIGQALAMLHHGIPPEQIISVLHGAGGQ